MFTSSPGRENNCHLFERPWLHNEKFPPITMNAFLLFSFLTPPIQANVQWKSFPPVPSASPSRHCVAQWGFRKNMLSLPKSSSQKSSDLLWLQLYTEATTNSSRPREAAKSDGVMPWLTLWHPPISGDQEGTHLES
uniref:Uncharacterized protein n=1 Tax=Molossus molossus TaxID=27622 RepID=A0A7J8DTD7_MOLMO|nr:hypothetical protein HJG59_009177 [Molossus molossus]